MKHLLIVLILLSLLCPIVLAGEGGAFLENPIGARAVGMGGAQVAVAQDSYATYWNPAGLALLKTAEISSMIGKVFNTVDHRYFAYARPLEFGTLALSFISTGVDDIERASLVNGVSTLTGGSFGYASSAWILSGGTSLARINRFLKSNYWDNLNDKVFIGSNLILINETLDSSKAGALAIDLGIQYQENQNTRFGLAFKNILASNLQWSQGASASDELPLKIVFGATYKGLPDWLFTSDLEWKNSAGYNYHLGAEYDLKNQLTVRGGFNKNSLSVGLGLTYHEAVFDYAYATAPENYMEATHLFSMSYQFSGKPQPKLNPKKKELQKSEPPKLKQAKKETPIPTVELPKEKVSTPQAPVMAPVEKPAIVQVVVLTGNIFGEKKKIEDTVTKAIIPVYPLLQLELNDKLKVNKSKLGIKGKVIDTKILTLNGKEIWANDKGLFYTVVNLANGRNRLTFKAKSRTGHEQIVIKNIYRTK